MSIYTRLTVAGASRRAEVVVANTEPLGAALPRLLDLLGETGGTVARPLTLIGADGDQLDVARTPQQLELADGTLLRLVRLDAAPPPPVVIDVTDAAADSLEARADRWDDRARTIAGGTGIAVAFAAAGFAIPWGDPMVAVWGLLASMTVLLAVSAGLGLGGLTRVSGCLAAAAAGLTLPLGVVSATAAVVHGSLSWPPLLAVTVVLAAASTVVLVGLGLARRRPGAAAGGALGAVLATLLLVLLVVGLPAVTAAAITGTIAAFATGPLPWIALSAAGLTDLDQRVADGQSLSRPRAWAAIDDAYSALTWSVAAVAAVLGLTGAALVLANELWSGLLALAFGLIAALRTRAFPLRAQGWALWAAVATIGITAILSQTSEGNGWIVAAAALGASVLIAVSVLVRPRPHTRARLRGIGNVIETLAVVSLLPLLLGALGVYTELLGMFGGGS